MWPRSSENMRMCNCFLFVVVVFVVVVVVVVVLTVLSQWALAFLSFCSESWQS